MVANMPTLQLWVNFAEAATAPSTWTNVGAYIRGDTTVERGGRVDPTAIAYRAEAGTLSVTLDNRDGRFDPFNLAGPYVSGGVTQLQPRREVALQAVWNSVTYGIWRGYADRWLPSYAMHGKDAVTKLTGSDGVSLFAGFTDATVAGFGSGDLTGIGPGGGQGRIYRCCELVGLPVAQRDIDAGLVTLQTQNFNRSAWDLACIAADTEAGELFFNGSGTLVFRDRSKLVSRAVSATFQPGTSLPFDDVTIANDQLLIRNFVQIAPLSGSPIDTAQDTASQAHYGKRSFARLDLPFSPSGYGADLAGYLLEQGAAPELRIESLAVNPLAAPATLWPEVLGRDVSDRITIAFTPTGSSAISRDGFIRGVKHTIGAASWRTSWTLQDATRFFPYLILDDANVGKLDTNRLGY